MQILHSSDARVGQPQADIQHLLKNVSETDLRAWVEEMSIPRHFSAQPENNRKVRDWIQKQFELWGYAVESQGPWANLVAHAPGVRKRLLLVGAHYDSVAGTPGADDNASAVAAMLGCARALAQAAPRPPVVFAAFNREEDDLMGSLNFVEHLAGRDWQVSHAHVLEMVGYAREKPGSQATPGGLPIKIPDVGNFLGLLGNHNSKTVVDAVLNQARTYLPEFPVVGLKIPGGVEWAFPVLLRSDHAPFWKRGISALMWTDTSEFRNPHYHKSTDTPDTLDYAYLRKVTQLLVACAMGQGSDQ